MRLASTGNGTVTVSGKWSTPKRCNCKDENGKEIGRTCPKLEKRHHGANGYDTRIPTTGGVRTLRRFGFATKGEADKAAAQVWELIKLAGADVKTQQRIGDLIFKSTARGGQLPAVEDVRRRLGLRRGELDVSETFGEAWAEWLAGRRRARDSYANTLGQHGRNWLLPVLKDIPLDRLTGEHCAMVFERIDMFNEEIEAAREAGRKPVLPGDVRGRTRHTGVATQHRIYGVLRVFLNHQWKKARKIPFNPVYAVELEPETRDAPLVWEPEQVDRFLEFTADDRLMLLWRLVLLRGFRRGEICGLADDDVDTGKAAVTVNVALVQVGGRLVWGRPKSKAGKRVVGLDKESVAAVKAHRTLRKRERLAAGEAWADSGRMFTGELGEPLHPDYVSRRFRELAEAAGLPVIKFHAARHTAATLALEAGIDIKIVSEQLGHSTTTITRDLYQHVRHQVQVDSAQKVVDLLPSRKRSQETGS
jgi:integrase